MSVPLLRKRDVPHLKIRASRLRAMLHEAWKNGNESENLHHQADGQKERHAYVDQIMVKNNFSTMVPENRANRLEASVAYRKLADLPEDLPQPIIEYQV